MTILVQSDDSDEESDVEVANILKQDEDTNEFRPRRTYIKRKKQFKSNLVHLLPGK